MIDIVLVRFAVRYFNSNYPEDVSLVLGKDATKRDTGKSINGTIRFKKVLAGLWTPNGEFLARSRQAMPGGPSHVILWASSLFRF